MLTGREDQRPRKHTTNYRATWHFYYTLLYIIKWKIKFGSFKYHHVLLDKQKNKKHVNSEVVDIWSNKLMKHAHTHTHTRCNYIPSEIKIGTFLWGLMPLSVQMCLWWYCESLNIVHDMPQLWDGRVSCCVMERLFAFGSLMPLRRLQETNSWCVAIFLSSVVTFSIS